MEDAKIVELYFARDELAVSATREKYGRLLYSLAERILGEKQDAEECLDDTLLALWNAIPPEKPESLKAYSCKTVRNLSFGRLSRNLAKKRAANSGVPLDELEASLSDGLSQARFSDAEFGIVLNSFLGKLRPTARAVFLKRYFFFDTVPEIARDLGMKDERVKSLLFRTKKKFIGFISEKGEDKQ